MVVSIGRARVSLDLNDILPLWERKLSHPLHQPELDSLVRRDVDLAVPPRRQYLIRDGRILTQDVVRAIIVGQRRVER